MAEKTAFEWVELRADKSGVMTADCWVGRWVVTKAVDLVCLMVANLVVVTVELRAVKKGCGKVEPTADKSVWQMADNLVSRSVVKRAE
jgi:hypothetical protein